MQYSKAFEAILGARSRNSCELLWITSEYIRLKCELEPIYIYIYLKIKYIGS